MFIALEMHAMSELCFKQNCSGVKYFGEMHVALFCISDPFETMKK